MPYNELEDGISAELSEARRDANQAEAHVDLHQERVRSFDDQLVAVADAKEAKRLELSATGRALAKGDADAMAAGKRLTAEIEELGREASVLAAARDATLEELKGAEKVLAAAKARIGFEEGKECAEEAIGLVEIMDEQLREFSRNGMRLIDLAREFASRTGDQSLLKLVLTRQRFAMAMRAADLQRFAELPPIYGSNRLFLTEQIGRFLQGWIDGGGLAPGASTTDDACDAIPDGCHLDHRGMGRWHAYGPDGAQIGGLHMSRTDAIAALRAVLIAA